MASLVHAPRLLDTLDKTTMVLFLLVGPAMGAGIVVIWAAGLAFTVLSSILR